MKIAISGGGIAGLSMAIYLTSSHHEVTIFERSKEFRSQGYGLSIKSFGIDILKSFGVFDELKSKGLPVSSFNLYRENGSLLREIPSSVIERMTGGAFPVARADVHAVLYKIVRAQVPVIFGKWITHIEHLANAERLTFNDGTCDEFDLIIVAEGFRSATRKILFDDEGWYSTDIKYMAARVKRAHHFESGVAHTYKGLAKTISFFPINDDDIVMQGYFKSKNVAHLPQDQIRELIQKTYHYFTEDVTAILNTLQEDDYIFYDSVAMIQLSRLVSERTVFIGDAGYSTTFLSGMGASLSLLGAKLLNEALQQEPAVKQSLKIFENKMIPIARHFQQNAFENMEKELPEKKSKLQLSNLITKFIPFSLMIKSVSNKLELKNLANS